MITPALISCLSAKHGIQILAVKASAQSSNGIIFLKNNFCPIWPKSFSQLNAGSVFEHSGTWPHSLLGLFRMQPQPRWQFFRAGFSPSSVQPVSCVGARSAAHMFMRIPQGILHHMGNLSQWRLGWTTASPILPWSGKPGKHLTGCPKGPSGIKPQPPTAVLTQGCIFTWVFFPFLFHFQAHFPHKLLEHKPFRLSVVPRLQ